METIVLTALGIIIGGFITIATAIGVEFLRKPRLGIRLCSPHDLKYNDPIPRPARRMKILNVEVLNKELPLIARWMSRNPAIQCHGTISFHHLDGQNIFGRVMEIRWGRAPEPVARQIVIRPDELSDRIVPKAWIISLVDPIVSLMQSRDVFPGESETINVAAKFEEEAECYGWCNDNYFSEPIWRNPSWRLRHDRFLVRVTIVSSGDKSTAVFRLMNDVAIDDFRLENCLGEERERVLRHC